MTTIKSRKAQGLLLVAALLLSAGTLFAQQYQQPNAGQMQPAPPAGQSSYCGNNALCFEGANFVATISQFRTSTNGGWRLIDVILHFQNKTNQPLSLGYVNGSASGMDDRGNRYGLSGNNGVRAMGVINGNNVDPKFVLQAGAGSDAAFEWAWGAGSALSGVSYSLDLDVREMDPIEGGQWVLGQETMMHYQGLANGMGMAPVNSGVPGQAYASSQGGCPAGMAPASIAGAANSAGLQNANATAQSAVSNAQTTLANLGSIFHKQNTASGNATNTTGTNTSGTNATNTASAAAPCVPITNGAASGYAGGSGYPSGSGYPAANGYPGTSGYPATTGYQSVPGGYSAPQQGGTASYPATYQQGTTNATYPATTTTPARSTVAPTGAAKSAVPMRPGTTNAVAARPVTTNAVAVQHAQPATTARTPAQVVQPAAKRTVTPPPPPAKKPVTPPARSQ